MSGAFETAAGAFAVVGVADVLVRTGRELYRFFNNVSDAPDEVKRLSECVRETILLVDALKKQARSNVDAAIVASVQAAVKALNRELQSLKLVLAKFKGSKTTWSRIKYALDEKKVLKTLNNLERSKSLLANSLNIIYGEMSAVRFSDTSTLIIQVGAKVDALQTLTSSLNTDCGVIKSKLDLHERNIVDKQNSHQQALKSHLTDHHQQNQQKISAVQLNQENFSSRQQRLLETSSRTEKRLLLLQAKGQKASRSSSQNHLKTRALLRDGFETLHAVLEKKTVRTKTSGNTVYFRGERVDMIMSYLLPIKDELNTIINQVLSQSHHSLPIEEMLFLREELQRLLGSAAQEEAARYAMSTATSFDEWHFLGLDNESIPSEAKSQDNHAPEDGEMIGSRRSIPEEQTKKKRDKTKMQTMSFKTGSREMKLHISQKNTTGHNNINSCDVGLSFISHAQSLTIVDIRFTQCILQQMRPRICAQLNVFTRVPYSLLKNHWRLFERGATIEEIERAIRNGSVSPYHLDAGEHPYLLRLAVSYGRIDVLRYFESHGIGITSLRQDKSVFNGLCIVYSGRSRRDDECEKVLRTFYYVEDLVYDSAGFTADLAIDFVLECYGMKDFSNEEASILNGYLVKLHKEGYDCAQFKLGNISTPAGFLWSRQSLCELMALLFEVSTKSQDSVSIEHNYISRLTEYDGHVRCRMHWALEDLHYALVQTGVDIYGLNFDLWTTSMAARYYDIWPTWCRALEDSGKNIDEVLRKEGTQWLLDDNWETVFAERYKAFGFCYNESSSDYESDSDLETPDEDDDEDAESEDAESEDAESEDAESEDAESEDAESENEDRDEDNSDEEGTEEEDSDEEMSYDHATGGSKMNGGKSI